MDNIKISGESDLNYRFYFNTGIYFFCINISSEVSRIIALAVHWYMSIVSFMCRITSTAVQQMQQHPKRK
jgi:hypothetical protein